MKCGRCPIHKECNKMGKVTLTGKDKEGKDMKPVKVCPLLWTVDTLVNLMKEM